jgi:hypothetical protein
MTFFRFVYTTVIYFDLLATLGELSLYSGLRHKPCYMPCIVTMCLCAELAPNSVVNHPMNRLQNLRVYSCINSHKKIIVYHSHRARHAMSWFLGLTLPSYKDVLPERLANKNARQSNAHKPAINRYAARSPKYGYYPSSPSPPSSHSDHLPYASHPPSTDPSLYPCH